MTPRERAEKIVERFLSTPEGFAPDDKQALIAAIEQGMNEVLEDAAGICDQVAKNHYKGAMMAGRGSNYDYHVLRADSYSLRALDIRALKSPDNSRNTITDNQKDEKR